MRFIPTSFFGGQVKPCVVAEGSGSVSQSFDLGSTHWEFYLFSASLQAGGGGVENFVFSILTGSTTAAIIGAVGGGGAGSSDGNGGGGGGFDLRTNVILNEGDYTIEVGQGAANVVRSGTPGAAFSGDDGRDSFIILPGQANIRGYGGKGGVLNGSGGASGQPTYYSSSFDAGDGAGGEATDNDASEGLSLYFGDNVQFRAGGGGAAEGGSSTNNPFGGGGGALFGDGLGGAIDENFFAFGGGAGGGQFFNAPLNEYRSNAGGAGCVFIAIPTNLCSSSLYEKKSITTDRLKYRYEMDNANTFGLEPYSNFLNDLNIGNNIPHVQEGVSAADINYLSNYTSSVNILSNISQSLLNIEIPGATNKDLLDVFSGSLPEFTATDDFTLEWTGQRNDSSVDLSLLRLSNDNNAPVLNLLTNPQRLVYTDTLSVETTLSATFDTNVHQHDIVYDGSILYWYIDTVLETSASVAIETELNNPTLRLGQGFDSVNDVDLKLNSFRVYQKELSQSEIDTNYSQSFDL